MDRCLALALSALVASCTAASNPDLARTDQNSCTSYGFTPGTDAHAACRLRLDEQRMAENAARRARLKGALNQIAQQPTYTPAPPPPAPRHCFATSSPMGRSVQTNIVCH